MKKPTLRALSVAVLTALCLGHLAPARADGVPNNTVRLGMYAIFYHTSADNLSGPFVPAGVNLDEKNTQTAYFAYIRRLSSAFDFEIAFGVPPKTDTIGRGPAKLGLVPYSGATIATAKWLAPSALLEYKFLPETSVFRPYVGVGVNYTAFFDRQTTAAGNAATGGPTRLSLTSSVGPVGTIGLKYQPLTHWHVAVSYSITKVDTDLKADTAGEIRTTHVKFGPQALVVAAGYSF